MPLHDSPKPMLIGGEHVTNANEPLVSVNPATGAINHTVCAAATAEVDLAVDSATRAAAHPTWRHLQPHQRAAVLHRVGDLMQRDAELFSHLQMIENGKVRSECIAQVRSAAATFRYYAAVCETLGSELTPARGDYLSMTVHEPYGVVAALTPWNSPMTMEAQKVAPALAAGNAVILKPSELTSSPALELGRIALEAGLPPGVLNVLPGTGATVGASLVAHRGVKMVSFTGGTASGRRVAATAAQKLMQVALELGGKSPHIVFADADIAAAVEAVAGGIFEGSGQSCVAGSRLFVQREVYQRVVELLLAKARDIRVDLPDATGAQMGPIASFSHREHIARQVDGARAAGARVLIGGAAPADARLAAGAFYLPTLVAGIENSTPIAQQEIFGPVLCVLPFESEEDVIAQANDSVYGLAAGIWTADYKRAWRVARALEAGTVWINTYKQLSIATPFGGFKESGLGREKGLTGMRLYQQTKSIYLGLDNA
jgi:betaine-aldehyde dehydrogenase